VTRTSIRVCVVSQAAYRLFDPQCDAPFGGAEAQMYLLAQALSTDPAYDVHFVTQDYGQAERQRVGEITLWRYSRPLKQARALGFLRWIASAWSLFWLLRTIDADVYLDSPAGFPTAVIALRCVVSRRARHVYWMASDADTDGGLSRFGLERALARWGIRSASAVIAQHAGQQKRLAEKFGVASTVLRNAFRVPSQRPVKSDGPVLWVASAQQLKQPHVFLDLVSAFPETRFSMVMPPSDAALFEQARERALRLPNLEFSDGVAFADIQQRFDEASVFVNTSTTEGFPNTFVQAAMGATPVLSLNINPDDVLTENGFGRCAQGEVSRLASDLRELLDDPELRGSMGEAGFEYARRCHDIDTVAEQLKSILAGVMA